MIIKKDWLLSKPFIAFFITLLFFLCSFIPKYEILERNLLDLSFVIRGAEKAHEDIVIIAVTDQSLKQVGSWPWPRSTHALLLQLLQRHKPSAIFFDMIFSEESTTADDQALAREIGVMGNVVLPIYFTKDPKNLMNVEPEGKPIDLFLHQTNRLGYVNAFPDTDGHSREIPLTLWNGRERFLHASLASVAIHQDLSEEELKPFYDQEQMLINIPGPFSVFPVIPYEYLFAQGWSEGLLKTLKGKIILLGHIATGTALDLKPSPFSPNFPGVGLQASAIHTILSGKHIYRVPYYILPIFIFLIAYLILEVCSRMGPLRAFCYSLGCLAVVFLLAIVYFKYFRLWIPYLGFLILIPTLYIAVTLIRFLKVQVEKEMLTRELTLASRIQKNLLPTEMPTIPGIEIDAMSLPAKHVGGDLYDVIGLSDDRWGVCVGDVSGKGVPAALFMAKSISEFRREADDPDTANVITGVNKKLSTEGVGGLFLTLLYIIVDVQKSEFTFSNGGHEPILHYKKKENKVDLLETDAGLPLGISEDCEFDAKTQSWEKGDVLILQSDGVKEAMNLKREIFGFDRAKVALLEAANEDCATIIAHMKKHIDKFVGDAPQHDDTTIVCIKHL